MRVVLAGGGTAGHIEPALALADALRRADGGIQVTCLGTNRGLENRLVPMRGYELALIPAVPLPRSVSPRLLTVPGRLAGAVHSAGTVLERVHADVLVGFGGYVATPAYLAAKRHKVPIVVHEANPFPGIANRLGARLTTHVFTGHPDTKLRNARYLGCRSGGRSPNSTGGISLPSRDSVNCLFPCNSVRNAVPLKVT